jgi:hypothetical protein
MERAMETKASIPRVAIGTTAQALIAAMSWELLAGIRATGIQGLHCHQVFKRTLREANRYHLVLPKNWTVG